MRGMTRFGMRLAAAAVLAAPLVAGPAWAARQVRLDIEELLAAAQPQPRVNDEATAADLLLHLLQDPGDVGAHINLGNLYARNDQFEMAERAYHRAIKLDDHDPIAWNNLGVLYLRLGKVGEAESCFKEALDQDSKYAVARYNLASIQDVRGDYDTALENYRVAIGLRPELADVKFNPYVVNNSHVVTVSLLNYLNREIHSLLTEKSPARMSKRVVGIAEPVSTRRR